MRRGGRGGRGGVVRVRRNPEIKEEEIKEEEEDRFQCRTCD